MAQNTMPCAMGPPEASDEDESVGDQIVHMPPASIHQGIEDPRDSFDQEDNPELDERMELNAKMGSLDLRIHPGLGKGKKSRVYFLHPSYHPYTFVGFLLFGILLGLVPSVPLVAMGKSKEDIVDVTFIVVTTGCAAAFATCGVLTLVRFWQLRAFRGKRFFGFLVAALLGAAVFGLWSAFLFKDKIVQYKSPGDLLSCIHGILLVFFPFTIALYPDYNYRALRRDFAAFIVIGALVILALLLVYFLLDENHDSTLMYKVIGTDVIKWVYSSCILAWLSAKQIDLRARIGISKFGNHAQIFDLWRFSLLLRFGMIWAIVVFKYVTTLLEWASGFIDAFEPQVIAFNPWLQMLFLWLAQGFPAILQMLTFLYGFPRLRTDIAWFGIFNWAFISFMISGFIIIIIYFQEVAFGADEKGILGWFWTAKLGAKWLLVLVPYQAFLGFNSVRSWLGRNGIWHLTLMIPLQPWHSLWLPGAIILCLILHAIGWIGILATLGWFTNDLLLPVITGFFGVLSFLLILLLYYWRQTWRLMMCKFRKFHNRLVLVFVCVIVPHGWLQITGFPYWWEVFIILSTFVLIEQISGWRSHRSLLRSFQRIRDPAQPAGGFWVLRLAIPKSRNSKWGFESGQYVHISWEMRTTELRIFRTRHRRSYTAARVTESEKEYLIEMHLRSRSGEACSLMTRLADEYPPGPNGVSVVPDSVKNPPINFFISRRGFLDEFAQSFSEPLSVVICGAGTGSGCSPIMGIFTNPRMQNRCRVFLGEGIATYLNYLEPFLAETPSTRVFRLRCHFGGEIFYEKTRALDGHIRELKKKQSVPRIEGSRVFLGEGQEAVMFDFEMRPGSPADANREFYVSAFGSLPPTREILQMMFADQEPDLCLSCGLIGTDVQAAFPDARHLAEAI